MCAASVTCELETASFSPRVEAPACTSSYVRQQLDCLSHNHDAVTAKYYFIHVYTALFPAPRDPCDFGAVSLQDIQVAHPKDYSTMYDKPSSLQAPSLDA